jgi:adenylyltransferase/sulfurtransferase
VNEGSRFARQLLLVEIGESGQRRLAGATARVGGAGFDHEVAETYARRAGIGEVTDGSIAPELAPAFLENDAARAVVAGSRAALAAMRVALGIEAPADALGDTPRSGRDR